MFQKPIFEEKILYKTQQHILVLIIGVFQGVCVFGLPIGVISYFLSYSFLIACIVFFVVGFFWFLYKYFLWKNSWLLIGNQKITLSVRNGIWSQYAMNIRYRNVRDSAVSKNNIWGYMFKYGTLFVRSSANEGEFRAEYIPKVGKVYALLNTLTRYNDEERSGISTVSNLHYYHQKSEFSK